MTKEEQEEEAEVLDAIYGQDSNFTAISEIKFQYKFGEDGDAHSFVLDIQWPEDYPEALPKFGLDAFYNNLLPTPLKTYLLKAIREESEKLIGTAQTYGILEFIRESLDTLFVMAEEQQLLEPKKAPTDDKETEEDGEKDNAASPKKKEQLTKSQKRREWDRKDAKGETARGGDWVDIVKHLSQTGHQDDPDSKT